MTGYNSITETTTSDSLLLRVTIFAYSVVVYVLFLASLSWFIISSVGVLPFGTGPLSVDSTGAALAINAVLVVLFGVQHSVMARQRFKDWWTQFIPTAAERSTFVLASSLAVGLLVWLWQPMPALIWSVTTPEARFGLWALCAFGWLYLVASTFPTNHFDLFGLRQGWLCLRNRPYTPTPFVRSWMYRYSRHPMMAGILIGLWATPEMRADHLTLSIGLSAYIAAGIAFEQRELAGHLGEKYRQYCREVGALFPRIRPRAVTKNGRTQR